MAEYKVEDIAGVYVDEELVCMECLTDDEHDFKEDAIVTRDEVEREAGEKIYFCDRSKKQLL